MRFHPSINRRINATGSLGPSHSSYTYSQSSYPRSSSMGSADYVKVLVIGLFSVFCIYTYFDGYFQIYAVTPKPGGQNTPRTLPSKMDLKLDDSLCNRFKDDLQLQCQSDFLYAAKDANSACDGYYQRIRSCSATCSIDKNNLDSCIQAVVRKVTRKWEATVPNS